MKRFIVMISLLAVVLSSVACELSFKVVGDSKDSYKKGDQVVVEVTLKLTHRVCNVDRKDTKFTYEGAKVLGATEWKEIEPGTFSRKIKLEATESKKNTIVLTATRTCDKDGGFGTFSLPLVK